MDMFSCITLFPCIILVIFICVKSISFDTKNRKNIPPSPPKLPIIGNFHQVGSNPNHNLQLLSQKYGPVMLLQLGSTPTLVASSAEVAREIMKTHDLSLCSRPSLTMSNILVFGSNGIAFAPYGESWRRLKSIVVLKLLSNARVKTYQKVRENEIRHMIRVLGESCGTTIDMGSVFISLTNNIICKVALGRKFDGLDQTHLVERFMNMLNMFCIGSYIPWLSWVDHVIGSIGRAKKIAKEFNELLEGVIEDHISKNKREDANARSDEAAEDFVDVLLDLQKDNTTTLHRDSIKALILEAFAAGTETIKTSVEWTMSELIKNPRAMKKLQEEVTKVGQGKSMISEDDLERMSYLRLVIKESLRLHTPFPLLLPRETTQDVKLMGYDVAAGTQVIINAWAIGRDPASWEEPNEFRPERFLNNNSFTHHGLQYEWIPFGAGRRSCPGIQLSVPVIKLAIANIVYKFDMALPNGIRNEDLDMTEAFGSTVNKKHSLHVLVTPRF